MITRKFSPLAQKLVILIAALAVICFLGFGILLGTEFRITSLQTTNGSVRISWDAPGGSNYIVQSTPRLIGGAPNTNFNDLPGSPIYVSPSGLQSSGYTDTNAMLNSTSRFYRVRSYAAPPTLQIQPTNVVMAPGMTNRYKVMLIYPDNNSQDVTALATNTSLSTNIARVVGVSSNGFLLVRGVTNGTASLRSVYQGLTNTASLTVAQMTNLYTVPSLLQISNYVGATNPSVYVIGSFANGQEKNVTPASNLQGAVEGAGAGGVTRVDYNVRADVANSFALITGQSAADGQTVQFEGGGVLTTNDISVHWCNYASLTLLPTNQKIGVGDWQPFLVIGNRADGTGEIVPPMDSFNFSFTSSDNNIAEAFPGDRVVIGRSPGTATISVRVSNQVNCGILSNFTTIVVTGAPPNITSQPADQLVVPGDNATFSVLASGYAPLAYQWQFNSLNLAGATNSSLTISNVSYAQQLDYLVIITNAYGSVTSSVAMLGVFVPPHVAWQADFGGANDDTLIAAVPTSDGGFILGGYTSSGASGNKTNGLVSIVPDWWVLKTDASGNKQWERTFGGNAFDSLTGIAQATNGDYFLAGYSSSTISGNKTVGTYGDRDYWLMRVDGNGNSLWQTNFGGTLADYCNTIVPTSDGGCLLAGSSYSGISGNKTASNFGSHDYWLVKVDSNGNQQWDKSYGGTLEEILGDHAVQQTADGGYIVAGGSTSGASGNKTNTKLGVADYWVIKLDGNGNKVWEKEFGGTGDQQPNAIRQTSDGGYIVAGYSTSGATGTKTTANFGSEDIWIIKLDSNGNEQWEQDYGGVNDDYMGDIQQTSDGGYLVGGTVLSSATGNMSSTNHGGYDFWLLKLDARGNKVWENTYGGTNDDTLVVMQVLTNNSVLLAGRSRSLNTGNKTVTGYGGEDYWLIKLASDPPSIVAGSQSRTTLPAQWPHVSNRLR